MKRIPDTVRLLKITSKQIYVYDVNSDCYYCTKCKERLTPHLFLIGYKFPHKNNCEAR